ncbi:TlpA disulfide reductase family protein [Crenothrix sp.]|uniref:TlpA disulfide reductase family protein n=1 Tax=Crenothrix sp. TaxID=3100433 RepID=UPI00374CB345
MSYPGIGQKAPLLQVSEWVQGEPVNLDQLQGYVVLVEVFQVNCPGCFIYSLPQAVDLHQRYHNQGLKVLGVATAFEDYDKNTLENLQKLLLDGETVGATLAALNAYGNGQFPYKIPFPVAMDKLTQQSNPPTDETIKAFIDTHLAQFERQSAAGQQKTRQRVSQYLQAKLFNAATFDSYALQGTPSHLLIDKQGILRARHFGHFAELESDIQALLNT